MKLDYTKGFSPPEFVRFNMGRTKYNLILHLQPKLWQKMAWQDKTFNLLGIKMSELYLTLA